MERFYNTHSLPLLQSTTPIPDMAWAFSGTLPTDFLPLCVHISDAKSQGRDKGGRRSQEAELPEEAGPRPASMNYIVHSYRTDVQFQPLLCSSFFLFQSFHISLGYLWTFLGRKHAKGNEVKSFYPSAHQPLWIKTSQWRSWKCKSKSEYLYSWWTEYLSTLLPISMQLIDESRVFKYFLYLDSGSGVTNGTRLSHSLGEMYSS